MESPTPSENDPCEPLRTTQIKPLAIAQTSTIKTPPQGPTTVKKSTKFQKWKIWKSPWYRAISEHPWVLEILSLFLAWSALVAIIAVLAVHQHRPLPQWPQLISINSLIAVFSAILKAALILPVAEGLGQLKWDWFRTTRALIDLDRLDAATRGPWGAFLLLTKAFRSYLVCLGALITVVALATDPFSQQVVQYYNCDQPTTGNAFLSAAVNYSRPHDGSASWLDPEMMGAMYSGLISPPANASSGVYFECRTGNCTFSREHDATHMSIAMCGKCSDLSNTILVNKTTPTPNSFIQHILPSMFDPELDDQGNITIRLLESELHADVFLTEVRDWFAIRGYYSTDPKWYLTAFDALMYRNCHCGGSHLTCEGCEPFAANCALFPCVKTYNATIENFRLKETEVSRVPMEINQFDGGAYILVANDTFHGGRRIACTSSPQPSEEHPVPLLLDRGHANFTDDAKYVYYPDGCIWNFGHGATVSLMSHFIEYLWTGNLSASTSPIPEVRLEGTPWLLSMFNNNNASIESFNSYINGLANSMTNVMRRYGDSSEVMRVTGTVSTFQTCIDVRWPWLSLPASLLVLATIFLVMTIWTTKTKRLMIWKSSPLALMLHGSVAGPSDEHEALIRLQDMEELARSRDARIEQSQSGWLFTVEQRSALDNKQNKKSRIAARFAQLLKRIRT